MKKRTSQPLGQLLVYDMVRMGLNPKQIAIKLNVSLNAVWHHFKRLKACGKIEKLGYGVYKTTGQPTPLSPSIPPPRPSQNMRLHDLVFKVKIPDRFAGWANRGHYILSLFPGKSESLINGQKIYFENYTFLLYDSWIVIYINRSFFGTDFLSIKPETQRFATDLLRRFFRACKLNLSMSREFPIEWTDRQHFSKINDPVARLFNKEKKKLKVPLSKGFFVIDFSGHIHEAETENNPSGLYMDKSFKPFFQDLEKNPGATISGLLLVDASARVRIARLEKKVFGI